MTDVSSHNIIKSNEVPQSLSTRKVADEQDTSQNHQYECIPEYLLTMTRHHHPPIVCHHSHQSCPQTNNTCSPPSSTAVVQEESSTPLLASTIPKESHKRGETSSPKSMMIGWTRRSPLSATKRKSIEQRHSFLSQLRKSSIL
jgi:hypothetical protein